MIFQGNEVSWYISPLGKPDKDNENTVFPGFPRGVLW